MLPIHYTVSEVRARLGSDLYLSTSSSSYKCIIYLTNGKASTLRPGVLPLGSL